jgi:hypothetical protein
MLPPDPETPGGLGLLLVDELCETSGVQQDLGPYLRLVRASARSIPPLPLTTPVATAPTLRRVQARCARPADAFMLEPPGRDPAGRSAIAVADPVPG